jgi:ATP-dependent DNA ligase
MQPTLVSRPFHHDGWVYEGKVDGYRMVASKDRRAVKRISRQGKDHTIRFPEIAAGVRRLETPRVILDGEAAVFDKQLVSRFDWLRHSSPPKLATPRLFMVVDGLHARGTLRAPERD